MAKTELRAWAVKGAEQRLVEIAEEARWIFSAFPELRAPGRGFADDTDAAPARTAAPKRRRPLSAAARKAVSARMTKYWAARRKARK